MGVDRAIEISPLAGLLTYVSVAGTKETGMLEE